MLKHALLSFTKHARWAVSGMAVILALVTLVAGCGAIAPSAPTPTPSPSATATPTVVQAIIVVNAITGSGAVVQQTQVAAIDPATGQQRWSRALMGHPGASMPAHLGNIVVVSVGIQASPYPASMIAAFDIHSGAELWNRAFSPNTQAYVGAAGSAIILVTSAVSPQSPGAAQGLSVSALNPADGKQIWQHTEPDQEMYGPLRAAGNVVYVQGGQLSGTDTSNVVTALNAATGAQLWQKALGTGTVLGAYADAGAYYVGLYPAHLVAAVRGQTTRELALPALSPFAASTLTAYRATDGAQLWQRSAFAVPQVEANGVLYTTSATLDSSGRLGFSVMALRPATGAPLWQSNQLGLGDPTSKPVAVVDADGVFVFAMPEASPSVHALKAATGTPQWTALANTTVQAAGAGMGSVFTATVPATPAGQPPQSANVTISALNATTGAVRWTHVVERSQTALLVLA